MINHQCIFEKNNIHPILKKALYVFCLCQIPMSSIADESQTATLNDLLKLSISELFNIPITSSSYFPETPFDVASSVTVIPSQDWEKRGARRLNDALLSAPSVIALPNFLAQSSVRIRGYAQSDARGIATLWDGVSITSFNLGSSDVDRPNIQLSTLGSIEVIRGPGSALYGSDAFHGVVSLNSFEADKDTNRVKARAGSNGFYSAGFNSSVKVANDWRLNFSVSSSGQPDQDIEYTYSGGTGEREFDYQSNTIVAKLASSPDKTWSYKVGVYYDDNDSNDFHGQGGQGLTPDRDIASVEANLAMLKFDMKYKLTEHSNLSLKTYYWDQHHDFERPINTTRDIKIYGDEHREEVQLVYSNEQFIDNTQLSVAVGTRNDKIDLQHREIFDTTTTFVDADLPYSGTGRHINSFLVDGKTTLAKKQWVIRYGFRVDDYSDFGSQFTPRLGAIYKLDNQSVLKALYGNSFRAANAAEIGGTTFIAGNPDIQPEELDTYELIYLKQTKDTKTEIVLFNNELKNGISAIDTNNDTFDDTRINLTESSAKGLEVTYLKKLNPWLIETSGSYIESKSKTDGTDFVAFPKIILNVGIGYDFSSDWTLYVNNRVHIDADESPIRPAISPEKLKDYWRMDINLTRSFKDKWQAFANIRNALNRDNFLPSLVNTEGGIPEDDISIDVGVNYKF